MGMVCSSEVRASAAIAEDVGFNSLPYPQFSDSFRIWCPHHYWAYNDREKKLKLFLRNYRGLQWVLSQCARSYSISSSGDSYHYQRKTKYIYVHFMKDPPVVRQGDDQHQNLAINPGPKIHECAQYWCLNWLWDWLEMLNIHGIK